MLKKFHFELKMRETMLNVLINVFLALIIACNAEASHLVGIPGLPLAISAVWPATGFALAALLLFGFKVWPGIFLGNFCTNFYHFYNGNHSMMAMLLAATTVSLGSLLQALLGGYILRRFSTSNYFGTVKDIVIFLLPAGILTCLIASTVGVITLYLYGAFSNWSFGLYIWTTFWIGDSMGVYIFTPLIVVWTFRRPSVSLRKYRFEAILMIASFIILNYLVFFRNYPVGQLFIPLSLWATCRFRMHGATVANFCIALTAIMFTTFGYGSYVANVVSNSLLIVVSCLEIMAAACLILAAAIEERDQAWS